MSDESADPALDRFLLELYGVPLERPSGAFADCVFERLAELIPFDGAFWSRASFANGKVRLHSLYLHKIARGGLEVWARHQDRDVIGPIALANPGRTVNAAALELVNDPVLMREVIRPFGLAHLLTTCLVDPTTRLTSSITLVRGLAGPAFTEAARQ